MTVRRILALVLVAWATSIQLRAEGDFDAPLRAYVGSFDFCAIGHLVPAGKNEQEQKMGNYKTTKIYWGEKARMKGRLHEIVEGLEDRLYNRDFIVLAKYRGKANGQREISFVRIPITGEGLWVGHLGLKGEEFISWDDVKRSLREMGFEKKDEDKAEDKESEKVSGC